MKNLLKKIVYGKLNKLFFTMYNFCTDVAFLFYDFFHRQKDYPKDVDIDTNITFIFKSFERQKMAKQLYKNLRKLYPNVKIVIADDSKIPLNICNDANLTIVHLPFNSGLSKGLNECIKFVDTPFVFRMDDDELLAKYSGLEKELLFLQNHPQIDLVGFTVKNALSRRSPIVDARAYLKSSMANAPKELVIKHRTKIDEKHFVLGKVPNVWIARTDKVRELGWDDNIRMIDHSEFFFRAAGNLVSVIGLDAQIWHRHNIFDISYQSYRSDVESDIEYIKKKHNI